MAKYRKLTDSEVRERSRQPRALQELPQDGKIEAILEQRPCYFDSLEGL